MPVVRAEVDARIGGAYRVRFRSLDGREHEAHGTFLELVPLRHVVMTYQYALGGEPDERGRTSRVEFELVAGVIVHLERRLHPARSLSANAGNETGPFFNLIKTGLEQFILSA